MNGRRIGTLIALGAVTSAGQKIVWTEVTADGVFRLWAVDPRGTAPARLITADTGAAVFLSSQYDLVFAEGRLHWIAADLDAERLALARQRRRHCDGYHPGAQHEHRPGRSPCPPPAHRSPPAARPGVGQR